MRRLLLAAALLVAGRAAAQAAPLRTEKLADGVYAILRDGDPLDPSDANSTVIVNDDDVIVVDANVVPSSSRAVIAEIRRLTRKPVRYVINTHVHDDHINGNAAYAAAYPGVQFIAHPATRASYVTETPAALAKNLHEIYPGEIARLKRALARGTRDDGTRYTERQVAMMRASLRSYEWFVREMRGFRPAPPTITMSDSLVLHRGERRIVVRHLGRANTAGDVVVYLPRERVLATGDVVVSPAPFAWESFPSEWADVLARLRAYPVDVLVPGHGALQRDWSYVERVESVFRAAVSEVRAAAADGAPLDSVRRRVTLDAHRANFTHGDSALDGMFTVFRDALVESAFADLRRRPATKTEP